MAAMDAAAWNAKYPIGSWVIVTLANRRRRLARTVALARRVGTHEFIELDAIQPGLILLTWCWPLKARALRTLAGRLVSARP
jgi:hypothetical protein